MGHYNNYFMKGRDSIPEKDNILIFNSDNDTTIHKHDFVELVYFTSGIGTHYINNMQHSIFNGHFCLLNTGVEHYYQILPHLNKEIKVKNLIFFPTFLDDKIRSEHFIDDVYEILYSKKIASSQKYIHISKDSNKEIASLLNLIETELILKKENYIEVVRRLLWTILQIIFRESDKKQTSSLSPTATRLLDLAIDDIEKNYATNLTAKSLSKKIGYSTVHFNSIFKEYTGTTFRKYLQTFRCKKAKDMLIYTDKSIEQIRKEVGYSDPKQFFTLFKSRYGTTPLKYRQEYNKNHSQHKNL